MARTIEEIDKAIHEFEDDIVRRYIKRTPLGHMMTRADHKKFNELMHEYAQAQSSKRG